MKSGQALIIMLLMLGVVLTVGLAIVSRSVTEISVSTAEEEAARALEAAETGVEKSLGGVIVGTGVTNQSVPSSGATFTVTNRSIGGSTAAYEIPYAIDSGDVTTIDLTGYNPVTRQIRVCWEKNSSGVPAIEVMHYFRENSTGAVYVGRIGLDRQNRGNGFTTSGLSNGCLGGPSGYARYVNLNLNGSGTFPVGVNAAGYTSLFLRIRVLYTNSQIAVVPLSGANLPVQAKEVTSLGKAGQSNQKLYVVQNNPDLPFMFDSAIFSGSSLTQ